MEPPSNPCLAEAIAVTRSYENGRVKALRGVNLQIEKGDFVAITGASGSGKTTLLQMLGGLDTPDSGEIRFRGQTLSSMGDLSSFRAQQVGFVFQSFHLLATLSACENVQVPMVESPLSRKDREQRAIQLLEQVGLESGSSTGHRSFPGVNDSGLPLRGAWPTTPTSFSPMNPPGTSTGNPLPW